MDMFTLMLFFPPSKKKILDVYSYVMYQSRTKVPSNEKDRGYNPERPKHFKQD